MTQPAAQAVLSNANSVLAVGKKPFASRRAMGLVAATVLMSAIALTPETARASDWYGALQNPSTSAREYGRNEALQATDGRLAEVVMVRAVELKNTNRVTLGSAIGAGLGVTAARNVDNSSTRSLARLVLGGAGAVAGQKIQQRFSRHQAIQITVMEKGANGRTKLTNVVQEADLPITPGEIVMLEGSGSKLRVVPLSPEFQAKLRGQQAQQPAAQTEGEVQFGTLEQRRAQQQRLETIDPVRRRVGEIDPVRQRVGTINPAQEQQDTEQAPTRPRPGR